MRKQLLSFTFFAVAAIFGANAASFSIDGQEYSYDLLIKKEIGPGVEYNRIRIPDFPLNINYMVVDLANPYNRIETQQANETLGSTESLANAYARQQAAGKKPIGGQNANFWVVSGQGVYSQFAMGATYSANLKNGQIITETNCYNDQWDGGPARTGVVGIDVDKKLWIESMSWKGYVSSDRWGDGQRHEIIQVNKYCRAAGEMTLYNSFYGRNKKFQTIEQVDGSWSVVDGKTCEVYLDLDEGQQWAVAKDFTATVKEVKTDGEAGTLGDYDLCLAGTASYKTVLEQLQPGDVVTLNYGWQSYANDAVPELENAVGGNAIVMLDGELTGRNDDEKYNYQVYSRSAYGMSEDGKTLYMFVIDKSTDPAYGTSAGCNTSVMCQIMKQLGAWTVCNVDAGGSAQLMVQGSVVNKTTEGSPRAVANGWMVFSTAPETAESDVISRIEFLDPELNLPVYTTYTPVILGYNVYGELIDENVEGVELSLDDESLGVGNGNVLQIAGNSGSGKLTASYGNITVTKDINVIEAELEIRLSDILVDGRDYAIEVLAKSGINEYQCDPSRLDWTVEDESVASISGGILKGLKNGTTVIEGTLGDFSVSANVTVELPEGEYMPVYREFPAEDIRLSQVGGTGISMSGYGEGFRLVYTGNGSSRGANITLNFNGKVVWSLPESFMLRINPGGSSVKKVSMTSVNALGEKTTSWVGFESVSDELPKNEETEIRMCLSDWCDPSDVGIYPITLNTLRFDMSASASGEEFEILIPKFEACYVEESGGIEESTISSDVVKVYPNPVLAGNEVRISVDGNATVSIYSISGVKVMDFVCQGEASIPTDGMKGIYIIKVDTENGVKTAKLVVK